MKLLMNMMTALIALGALLTVGALVIALYYVARGDYGDQISAIILTAIGFVAAICTLVVSGVSFFVGRQQSPPTTKLAKYGLAVGGASLIAHSILFILA